MKYIRKFDEAHFMTDDLINEYSKKIRKGYSKAGTEIKRRIAKYLEEHRDEIENYQGEKQWSETKFQKSEQRKKVIEDASAILTGANVIAIELMGMYIEQAVGTNYNWNVWNTGKRLKMGTGSIMYNHEAVKKLMKNSNELRLPHVDVPKDQEWNARRLNRQLIQGIRKGESIPKISKRMQYVTDMTREQAIRSARTMMTCAENSGRQEAFERLSKLGVKGKKRWVATHDARTRPTHVEADGQQVNIDDMFDVGAGRLAYPADYLNGASIPEEIYNCRCSMVFDEEGIDTEKLVRERLREGFEDEGLSYDDWVRKYGNGN